jgi:hypothetical protein
VSAGPDEHRVDGRRAVFYAPPALAAVPRHLGQLDREPWSRTYGSFDRDHWSWKFRDFPIGVLQWAGMLPLAWLWRLDLPDNSWRGSPAMLQWTRAALQRLLARQHRNGAFDSVGPYTQDMGASLAACYYMGATAEALGDALPPDEQDQMRDAMRRAVAFSRHASEDYAFISNHHALFALGLVTAATWCERPQFREQADAMLQDIFAHQSADGFYAEYGGNDPGYESLGIDFLARIWTRTGDARLLDSLRKAVAYYAWTVHLDGSLGGALGSRHSRLWFPAGFERLAPQIPEAASVAAFMRERLDLAEVVTPHTVDAQNLPVMLGSYLAACQVPGAPLAAAPLPCMELRGVRAFEGGMIAAGRERYYALGALHKGATLRVVARDTHRVVHEDAGWVARCDGVTYASQMLGLSAWRRTDADGAASRTPFGLVRQEQITPARFVLLRILNLTLFRSITLGAWVRRVLIGRLITRVEAGPLTLERRLRFTEEAVQVHDTIHLTGNAHVESIELARSFTGIHMGSSKYFHPSEGEPLALPATQELAAQLNRGRVGEVQFTIAAAVQGHAAVGP